MPGGNNYMIDYIVTSEDKSKEIKLLDEDFVLIDGKKKKYNLIELKHNNYLLKIDNKIYQASMLFNLNGAVDIFINQKTYKVNVLTSLQDKALKLIQQSELNQSSSTKITSPMPGLVIKINKSLGDKVKKGETVLVLEAMKMENEIKAPIDGQITELKIKSGLAVEKNTLLFVIE
jgi:biotin carboxyl carrier protein